MERRNFLKLACASPFLGLIPKSKVAESSCSGLTLEKILEVKHHLVDEEGEYLDGTYFYVNAMTEAQNRVVDNIIIKALG